MPSTLAHAKINLSLEILGKRHDGYHDLVSVMQEVSLADRMEIEVAEDLQLRCDIECGPIASNLVMRAAHALRTEAGGPGTHITLHKRIPVGAGLGGGSSDAAAAMITLNRLWGLEYPCPVLTERAAAVGSDVPFFLTGGTALVEGRGEVVTALPSHGVSWYALTNPGFSVSTAAIFARLPSASWTDGTATRQLASDIRAGAAPSLAVNALQGALFDAYPAALRCFQHADGLAPGHTVVSGSGPTIVSQFDTEEEATTAALALRKVGYWSCVVRNCPTEERNLPCRALSSL